MIASDQAVFFGDLEINGWFIENGDLWMCRRKGPTWENVCIMWSEDDEDGNPDTIFHMWVEPEWWKPLNIAPNESSEKGFLIYKMIFGTGMFNPEAYARGECDRFLEMCSGKTHREAIAVMNNL